MEKQSEDISIPDLDKAIDDMKKVLKGMFPNIWELSLEKNWFFCRLLENYKKENIHWMSLFLDSNWYDNKWNR